MSRGIPRWFACITCLAPLLDVEGTHESTYVNQGAERCTGREFTNITLAECLFEASREEDPVPECVSFMVLVQTSRSICQECPKCGEGMVPSTNIYTQYKLGLHCSIIEDYPTLGQGRCFQSGFSLLARDCQRDWCKARLAWKEYLKARDVLGWQIKETVPKQDCGNHMKTYDLDNVCQAVQLEEKAEPEENTNFNVESSRVAEEDTSSGEAEDEGGVDVVIIVVIVCALLCVIGCCAIVPRMHMAADDLESGGNTPGVKKAVKRISAIAVSAFHPSMQKTNQTTVPDDSPRKGPIAQTMSNAKNVNVIPNSPYDPTGRASPHAWK